MELTSRKNDKVQHMKRLGASREYRREAGEFLCDGAKLLEEALRWGADIRNVFACGDLSPKGLEGAGVYRVTREILKAVSPLKAPQDVVFSVGIPKGEEPGDLSGAVILENMQDPGNVGTMLRTANAFGIETVVLTGECADVYNPKTVRASMGAVFRQRVVERTLPELQRALAGTPLYGAALREDARDLRDVDLRGCAVAIGNEGSGLSDGLLKLCAGSVVIPMNPACESLNAAAAAAVLLWEMAKDRL